MSILYICCGQPVPLNEHLEGTCPHCGKTIDLRAAEVERECPRGGT